MTDKMAHMIKTGLTSFQLKWIALFFMTIDHLASYGFEIPFIAQHYTWFRRVGRIAMPLFLFVLVQGAYHTRSKHRFLLRLYAAGMGAGLFVTVTNLLWGDTVGYVTPGNIIFTFFYLILYIILLEKLVEAVKSRRIDRIVTALFVMCAAATVPLILREALIHQINSRAEMPIRFVLANLVDSILPSFVSMDYDWSIVLLGVLMYFARTKRQQCLIFAVFCSICIIGTYAFAAFPALHIVDYIPYVAAYSTTFFHPTQCYMLMALPFMMLYNGRRGRGPKWFFYAYYPIHRYVISVIEALLMN